jgi:hypothetical protein
MGSIAQSNGHDAPGLIDAPVPGAAAMIDDLVAGLEHAVRAPVLAQGRFTLLPLWREAR